MKINKISNRIIAIFFICILVVPVLTLNRQNGKVSETENRRLASFPKLFDGEGHLADGARSGFESWWGDNLGMRSRFVDLATRIQLNVLHQSTSEKVEIGRDGWYYFTSNNNIELATGEYTLSQKTLQTIAQNQQAISDWYEKRGAKYIYGACYLLNWATLRSIVWFMALSCPVLLLLLVIKLTVG